MTATKNNSIFKKLGALAMAMCLTCALAVSANALVPDDTYDAYLVVESSVPHTLDFFNNPSTVLEDGVTVKVPLKGTGTIVVTPYPVYSYEATGYISSATISAESEAEGYDAEIADGNLYVTCPEDIDESDFAALINFTVQITDTEGQVTSHREVPATLKLV